jgi:hypothetical protein
MEKGSPHIGSRPFPLSARMQRNGANTYSLYVG